MKRTIFFAILFIVVLAATYLGASILIRTVRSQVAQGKGVAFIQNLYAEYAIVGESCQGEDTDADSYVSCDFRLRNAQSEERIVHLQCPGIWKSIIGNTCKESRLMLPQ